MNVSRETMTVKKRGRNINPGDIVCLGEREAYVDKVVEVITTLAMLLRDITGSRWVTIEPNKVYDTLPKETE